MDGSAPGEDLESAASGQGMIQEIPRDYLMRRLGGAVGKKSSMTASSRPSATGGSWKDYVKTTYKESHPGAPRMDEKLAVATGKARIGGVLVHGARRFEAMSFVQTSPPLSPHHLSLIS